MIVHRGDPSFAFILIPGTASRACVSALAPDYATEEHYTRDLSKRRFSVRPSHHFVPDPNDIDEAENLAVYCMVRNPYERARSVWQSWEAYTQEGLSLCDWLSEHRTELEEEGTMASFVRDWRLTRALRYERLPGEWDYFVRHVLRARNRPLPAAGVRAAYALSDAERALIRDIFEEDFVRFGYEP